jgi:hypothetical protein
MQTKEVRKTTLRCIRGNGSSSSLRVPLFFCYTLSLRSNRKAEQSVLGALLICPPAPTMQATFFSLAARRPRTPRESLGESVGFAGSMISMEARSFVSLRPSRVTRTEILRIKAGGMALSTPPPTSSAYILWINRRNV